jgi:hypothetical protein
MRCLLLLFALATVVALTGDTPTRAQDSKLSTVYEMRVYYAMPGKLDALHARFKNHTLRLFEKHGLTNVGYFTPLDNKDNKLVYFISAPSKAARDKSFKEFATDADWQKAVKESEKDGKLVNKVESRFLSATDYSPALKVEKGKEERVFELRTYTATNGNLGLLNDRFKDFTLKLFEKHGMTNIVYWNLLKGEKDADKMLVYLLAHKSKDEAAKSFAAFGMDPEWVAARKASEQKAGGSLTEAKGGVKSEFLRPTEYSPLQ